MYFFWGGGVLFEGLWSHETGGDDWVGGGLVKQEG